VIKESAKEIVGREAESMLKEDLQQWRCAIAAHRGPGESDSRQVCKSHFHLRWTIGTGAGERRPWLGRSFAKWRNAREETEITRKKMRNGSGVRND
jgi:hypothetical protein